MVVQSDHIRVRESHKMFCGAVQLLWGSRNPQEGEPINTLKSDEVG